MTNNLLKTVKMVVVVSSLFFVQFTRAESAGVESLSVEVRQVLQKEMIFIDSAMKDIISANAAGELDKISDIAKKMKESFILKQALSNDQKHELHSKLPNEFLLLDEEFHYLAGMLDHVAKNKKNELVGFYFSKLFESCANCHGVYAKHKFKGFSNVMNVNEHKH